MNADDLLFASVRARFLDSPQDVAMDLQHAAEHPERLDGVTPYQALAEAGELLTVAGCHDQAVSLLRRAVAGTQESRDSAARISLAAALARAGGAAEPEGSLPAEPEAPPRAEPEAPSPDAATGQGPQVGLGARLEAALAADNGDQLAQARRRAAAAIEHAQHSALRHRLAQLALERKREMDQASREQARTAHGAARPAPAGGPAPFSWPGGAAPGSHFFPARAGDAVLWWPDGQYQRLMRQLPELAPALGWPWPQHITNIENTLRSIAATGQGTGWLVPAEFSHFVGYLKQTSADPRAAEALRGYAAHAVVSGTPAPWPPRPRKPCWCGSDQRYKDCCGVAPRGTTAV